MHFVACKNVREYNWKQEKKKQFLLTEKKQRKQAQATSSSLATYNPGPSDQLETQDPVQANRYPDHSNHYNLIRKHNCKNEKTQHLQNESHKREKTSENDQKKRQWPKAN